MKNYYNLLYITIGAVICSAFLLQSCTKSEQTNDSELAKYKKADVYDNGLKIKFDPESPGLKLFNVKTADKGTTILSVVAPARVVASISKAVTSNAQIILFESSDITSLYSQYRQAKVNLSKSQKNLERIKDMFNNHTATAKDVSDAETDLANGQTSLAEMEGKLRTLGYNPLELEKTPAHSAWLICDVSESQIKDVQKGERVSILFSSFPDKKFYGRAESVGDVVDPQTRTIKVRVTLENPGDKFIPGMFARVDFGDPVRDVIILPQSSVVTVDGKDYAFVKTSDGTFERRQVTTSFSVNKEIIVLHGLNPGELVVTEGAMLLKGLSFGF